VKTPALINYGHNQLVLQQGAELARRFASHQVVTPVYIPPVWARRLSRRFPRMAGPIMRRTHADLPAARVTSYPRELVYLAAARLMRRPFSYFSSHDRMARRMVRHFSPPKLILAVDTGAESIFTAWAGAAIRVLDLTIAVPQYRVKIYRDAESDPANRGVHFHYPGEWELRRYAAELRLADAILCPSPFVMDSCRHSGVPPEKLHLLPYGFDGVASSIPDHPVFNGRGLKMVFAGTFCHRKGSHLLLQAFARYRATDPEAELHIFGHIADKPDAWPAGVTLHGHVPLSTLTDWLQKMHVMVFPTFFEGSSLVVYQALANGLPVVTTVNCGSVVDSSCGRLLPDVSVAALDQALAEIKRTPAMLDRWSQGALIRARTFTMKTYGDRLASILRCLEPSLT
jgi:glycosyltransferase involved in cell wall biosynthesis